MKTTACVFAVSLFVLLSRYDIHAQVYRLTPLPMQSPTGINDSGAVTGHGWGYSYLWQNDVTTGIGGLYPGGSSVALAINNSKQISGYADPSVDHPLGVAFRWENGLMANLGVHADYYSRGNCINDSGDVAGDASDSAGVHPFLWKDGVVTELAALGDHGSGASGINNLGQVVGWSWLSDTIGHAFLWENGSASDLGVLSSGNISQATAINNLGQVVGFSSLDGSAGAAAFLWSSGAMTNLGYLVDSPWAYSNASDINDAGEVVGSASGAHIWGNNVEQLAFIWRDGVMTNLNDIADTSDGWILGGATGINNHGDIICWASHHGFLEAALLTKENIVVTRPRAADFWYGGDSEEIQWLAPKGKPLNIYYTEDFRPEAPLWVPIIMGYPSDSEKYMWKIPDSLNSRHAAIRIVDQTDPSRFAFSQSFRIRTLEMVRLNADETYTRYRQGVDSWTFGNSPGIMWPKSWYFSFNYQSGTDPYLHEPYPNESPFNSAADSDFVDWPLFVRTFGFDRCYQQVWFGFDTSYNQFATAKWKAGKSAWGGSCSGMSLSSILAFDDRERFVARYPSFPAAGNLAGIGISDSLRLIINELFNHWDGQQHLSYFASVKNRSARNLIEDLKSQFLNDYNAHKYLYLAWKDSKGKDAAHAIVPYKLEPDPSGPGKYKVRVYDVSYPAVNPAYVLIDSTGDSVVAPLWSSKKLIRACLMDEAVSYLQLPNLGAVERQEGVVPASTLYADIRIYPSGNPSVLIESVNGKLGYTDGSLTDSLPGGAGYIPPTASPSPPLAYALPWNSYRITLGAFRGSHAGISRQSFYRVYGYEREDADSTQTDVLSINDGMTLENHDPVSKNVAIESIGDFGGGSILYRFSGLAVAAEESLSIEEKNGGAILKNFGGAKLCDVFVNRAYYYRREATFRHSGLVIPGNASLTFAQGDDSIGTLRMITDNGNDGTNDDTSFVSNDILGVEESGMPQSFVLHQNYPNPFNPRTTIRYDLPRASRVLLKIYDVFGREVATLVDERQEAGVRSVEWNAVNYASGVYFYELRAGGFVSSKKLLLVR